MRDDDLPDELLSLIGEGFFPDRASLLSFCLAVGLSREEKEEGPFSEVPADISEWEIWPMVQLVAYDMDGSVSDLTQMKDLILPFLNGGTRVVMERIGRSRGEKALKRISELLPS